jgi:stage II sporulation protein D
LSGFAVGTRDPSGRASTVRVAGERTHVVRGEDIRAILNRTFGDRAIMSTRFAVERRGTAYRFTGTGFGHGVGLCQTGAAARAAAGQAAADILTAYFPGSSLSRPLSPRPVSSANLLGGDRPALLHSP